MADEATTTEAPAPEASVTPEAQPEVETELETIEHDAEQGVRDAIAEAQALISRLQGHLNDNPPVPDGPNGPAK